MYASFFKHNETSCVYWKEFWETTGVLPFQEVESFLLKESTYFSSYYEALF